MTKVAAALEGLGDDCTSQKFAYLGELVLDDFDADHLVSVSLN